MEKLETIEQRGTNKAKKKEFSELKKKEKKVAQNESPKEESFNFTTDFWENYEGEVSEDSEEMADAFTF